MLSFSRPPLFSSAVLSLKNLPIFRCLAIFAKLFSFTSAALSLLMSPSAILLNFLKRYSATSRSITASPKNSSLSLFNACLVLLCVSASSKSSVFLNLYPRFFSNSSKIFIFHSHLLFLMPHLLPSGRTPRFQGVQRAP